MLTRLIFGLLLVSAAACGRRARAPAFGLPPRPDAPVGNASSPAKIALGRELFFDKRLSSDGTIACASCHRPDQMFAGHERVAVGVGGALGNHNVPSLYNVAYLPRLMSDGRAGSLEAQVRYPVRHPSELSSDEDDVEARIAADPHYAAEFARVFGDEPVTYEHVTMALAAFERELLAGDSPFDRFFLEHDEGALSPAARRGWELFRGKAGCIQCHQLDAANSFLTDFDYHNTGIGSERAQPELGFWVMSKQRSDIGKFRTPSLRSVAVTAPYMHDGRFATLDEVVDFYDRGGIPNRRLDERLHPLGLSADEKHDLVELLRSFTCRSLSAPGGEAAL